jgi:chaperonin GroES
MGKFKLQALNDNVIVEEKEAITVSAGGILLADNAVEQPNEGIVRAVGSNVARDSLVRVGHTVVYGKYAGTRITKDDKKYIVMSYKDILTVRKDV